MSFALRAGYDAVYRHVINVSLKKTSLWKNGLLVVNGVNFNIDSSRDNLIEIVKYHDLNTLMVNNAIIYENRKLFTYDVDLNMNIHYNDFSKKNLYNYIDFNVIGYNDIENIFSRRCLN